MAQKSSNPKIVVHPSGPIPPPPSSKVAGLGDMASGVVPPMPTADPPTDAAVEGGRRAPKGQ